MGLVFPASKKRLMIDESTVKLLNYLKRSRIIKQIKYSEDFYRGLDHVYLRLETFREILLALSGKVD